MGVNIIGGTTPYTQNWNGVNPLALSVGQYNFTIINSNGCTESNQVLIPSLSNISVVDTVIHPKCFEFCDGSVDLTITSGVSPYIINWFAYSPDSLCEGIYFYKITDSLGCEYEDSVLIVSPPPLTHNIIYQSNILEDIVIGGTPPYTWYWWNSTTSLGGGSTIVPTTNGNYYCVVSDSNQCHTDTIYYFVNDIVSNIDALEGIVFKVFPNPSNGLFNIIIYGANNRHLSFKVYNIIGEVIIMQYLYNLEDGFSTQINLKNKARGVYILEIETEMGVINKKLILQ